MITKLIIGLGNPGTKYINTRHNIGFTIINKLTEDLSLTWKENPLGHYSIHINPEINKKIIYAKPMTYMNLSGNYVQQLKNYYKILDSNILIILDDVYIPIGSIKFKTQGTAAGHNGLKSIIENCNSFNIPRLKIGIGKTETKQLQNYVLDNLPTKEYNQIINNYPEIKRIINEFISL